MTTTVRVEPVVLATREAEMRRLTVGLAMAMRRSFNAGPVDETYYQLHERWTKAQEKLTTGLTEIADILKALREAFEALDDALAGGLRSSGGEQ